MCFCMSKNVLKLINYLKYTVMKKAFLLLMFIKSILIIAQDKSTQIISEFTTSHITTANITNESSYKFSLFIDRIIIEPLDKEVLKTYKKIKQSPIQEINMEFIKENEDPEDDKTTYNGTLKKGDLILKYTITFDNIDKSKVWVVMKSKDTFKETSQTARYFNM